MSVAVSFAAPSSFMIHASGDVTLEECLRAESELISHPQLDARSLVLVDGREVLSAPTTTELRVIARELKPLRDRGVGRLAVLAATDFVYGVTRMFGVFARTWGLDVQAFRDAQTARSWLVGDQPAR